MENKQDTLPADVVEYRELLYGQSEDGWSIERLINERIMGEWGGRVPKHRLSLCSDLTTFLGRDISLDDLGDETYGKDSRIYVPTSSIEERIRLEDFLDNAGHVVHRDYWPGHNVIEVSVQWFKGWHWDE